ncbi:hypothetical protein DYC54_17610 [Vibrio cholerae]|uniref:hypothetical protein n=1 Tax=Vibrio cholerae TaxID=666 RepID=UPI0011DA6662|nr:hypothetical protein [Vibrio cholerae]EGR2464993.1 hypothetical protein [Vibrio cholerae]MBJ6903353.1 hypothetical protein [Vibrio cholerae]TXZ14970.1 hypothetical protein FXE59_07725 [Vibrio cholerae]HDI3182324.1 hypothetical protein [Vibrio cholerae]
MNKYIKLTLGTIGAIVIGAIGSGVWEYILQPVLKNGSNAFLELATLGAESYKDDLYQEVAKGYQEKASFSLLLSFNALLVSAYLVICGIMVLKGKEVIKKERKLLKDIDRLKCPEEETEHYEPLARLEEIETSIRNSGSKKLLKLSYVMSLFILVFCASEVISVIKEQYINRSVTYYVQLTQIVKPYIEYEALIKIESDFAQVQSSADYSQVIQSLIEVANENELKTPTFDIW